MINVAILVILLLVFIVVLRFIAKFAVMAIIGLALLYVAFPETFGGLHERLIELRLRLDTVDWAEKWDLFSNWVRSFLENKEAEASSSGSASSDDGKI